MTYGLGIDAGGTYTDAVIIRDGDGVVVDFAKALTTYPDPIGGIREALDRLDPEKIKNTKIVSISTTLSTNTILENTGFPAGLIMIGEYRLPDIVPVENYCVVNGGHDGNGEERQPLDMEKVIEFAQKVKDKVNAFAVSSLFSIRNNDHESAVKREVEKQTGLPVVCGNSLSQDLGAYERAMTAYLNARLIPVTYKFTEKIQEEMENRDIKATLLMMKCDGSVVGIKEALEKPIETIFSGPASSLMGAAHLSGKNDCAVIDIGGTSTDVAMIRNGLPEMSDSGAIVGGWKTRVKALRMETIATGGDSHIYVTEKPYIKYHIGPGRVIPLCRASSLYKGFKEKLKNAKSPGKKYMGEFIYPTVFYIRKESDFKNLLEIEKKHLNAISSEEPTSWEEMKQILGGIPLATALKSLVQKRMIQQIGFTPTDAHHITKEFIRWDREASIIGAEKLNGIVKTTPENFSKEIKQIVSRNIAGALIEYLLPGFEKNDMQRVLSGEYNTHFKVDIPIVLIGASCKTYISDLKEILGADVIAPKYFEVGNAVGALVGKGIRRLEISIFAKSSENINHEQNILNSATKDTSYYVFVSGKRNVFKSYSKALDFAYKKGKETAENELVSAGIPKKNIKTQIIKNHFIPTGWIGPPPETKLTFISVGIHEYKKVT